MFCWMLMDMRLPEFDAYQGAAAPSFLKVTPTLNVLIFSKKGFSDVRSEIHLD